MRRGAWLAMIACAASIGAIAAACLPDLPEIDISVPHGSASMCGDGIIDLDAGEQCDPGEAGAIGCGACRIQCEGGAIDPASGHCYFAIAQTTSIAFALSACRDAGAHVSTFASAEELALAASVAGEGAGDFWVGIEHEPGLIDENGYVPPRSIEPGWAPSCPGCFAQIPPDASTIPTDPATGSASCIRASKTGTHDWTQSRCSDVPPRDTICEREPVGSRSSFCIGGVCFDVPKTVGKKRYLLVPTPMRAEEARPTCESAAGSLAIFDTREEREQVAREIDEQRVVGKVAAFWIGMATDDAGIWTWESDAAAPPPWGGGEPAGSAPRAYVKIELGAIDSELAHPGAPNDVYPALCQIAVQ